MYPRPESEGLIPGRAEKNPRAWRWVVAIAVVCALPGLASHLINDDYLHRAVYQGAVPDYERDAFSLYDFMGDDTAASQELRERGYMPWWSSDDLMVRFFRPVSSATLAADIELFGDAALPALLHGALYFVLSVCLVFAILRMLLAPRSATVGALLYALAGWHAVPLSWIAARHVLVAACLSLAAMWLHLCWRERGVGSGRWLAPPVLFLGLLASESSLGAVAFIACYELLGAHGSWRQRLASGAPVVLLALGYLAWYMSAGYGARGTGLYLNPIADPGAYTAAAATRIPALVGDMLASIPSILYTTTPEMAVTLPILGLLVLGLTAWLFRSVAGLLTGAERRHIRWLAAGSLAALLPVAGGVIGGRLLLIAGLGATAVLGAVFAHVFIRAREVSKLRGLALRIGAVVHIALFVGFGVLMHVGIPLLYRDIGAEQWRIARDSMVECPRDGDGVLLFAADPSVTSYAPAAMLLMGRTDVPRSLWVLSMAPQDHRLVVLDEHALELSVVGPRQRNWWEWVHRATPVQAGERFQVGDMTIEVLAVEANGPSQIRVRFERRLDADSLCFVAWRDGLLRPTSLPAPGQGVVIEMEPGPMTR